MNKKTDKLLKRPDALQTWFFHALDRMKTEQKKVIAIITPVVLLIAAAGAWQYYSYLQVGKRKHELAQIEKLFKKEEREASKKKSDITDAIAKMEKEAKDKKIDNKAQIDSKRKEMEAIKENHTESLAKFMEFFKANEKSPEGWVAGMTAVEQLLKDKNYETSAGILSKILSHSLGIDFYQVQVRLMYIAVLEDLKKYPEALAETEKLIPLAATDLHPRIYLNKSRIELEAGKKEDANKTLDMIVSKYSGTSEARQAQAIKAL